MTFSRPLLRRTALLAAATLWLSGCASTGTASGSADVTSSAEQLRRAMVDPTPQGLDALVAEQLSYGHSGGRVDTKQSFIADLLSGKSDFVTLDLTEQTVQLSGDVALIRHTLSAKTNDAGQPGNVNLKVLQVWQRQGAGWRLLARQAVRVPA